jgi:hypothetical protein
MWGLGTTLLISHTEQLMEDIMTLLMMVLEAKGLSLAEICFLWIKRKRSKLKITYIIEFTILEFVNKYLKGLSITLKLN